ncbi:MAG: ArnT family glycosyltransferase [Candidatus Paceibacterota bacterium]
MFDVVAIVVKLRRAFSRRDVLIILGLSVLFFVSRLIYLDQFPIFSDEGIYIRWAKVAWKDATWRFISLTDGRQPLQTWGTIFFLKLFADSPLFAGRLFSVFSGFGALAGFFTLLYYLFNKKAAYVGSLLYILTPAFLFYDRMALVDSAVNAGFIWILFLSIFLARTLRFDVALLFGLTAGFALLAKSSVRLYVGLSVLAVSFIFYEQGQGVTSILASVKKRIISRNWDVHLYTLKKLLSFIVLYFVGVFIAAVIYNVQRLSPFFHYVAEKNKTFVLTFSELLANPFQLFFANLPKIPYYVFSEMGYVIGVVGIAGIFLLWRRNKAFTLYLSSVLILSYFAIAAVAKVIFPRYLLPLSTLLVVSAVYLLVAIKDARSKFVVALLIVVSVVYFDYAILFDYSQIPFPPIDRGQYIEGKTAGWGARDIVDFARGKSQEKPVYLLAEGNFGLIGDVLETFKLPGDEIHVNGYWPLNKEHLLENQELLGENYVYVVFSHRSEFPQDWPMVLVKKYEKPGGQAAIYLFELTN